MEATVVNMEVVARPHPLPGLHRGGHGRQPRGEARRQHADQRVTHQPTQHHHSCYGLNIISSIKRYNFTKHKFMIYLLILRLLLMCRVYDTLAFIVSPKKET